MDPAFKELIGQEDPGAMTCRRRQKRGAQRWVGGIHRQLLELQGKQVLPGKGVWRLLGRRRVDAGVWQRVSWGHLAGLLSGNWGDAQQKDMRRLFGLGRGGCERSSGGIILLPLLLVVTGQPGH